MLYRLHSVTPAPQFLDQPLGGVAVSDPTYMEVGEKDGKSFQLQQNAAYATHTSLGNCLLLQNSLCYLTIEYSSTTAQSPNITCTQMPVESSVE